MNVEQELKLSLTESSFRALSALTKNAPHLQVNHYFAPSGSPLRPSETMVRIREKDGAFVLCCKRRISNTDGVSVCDERECPLESDTAHDFVARGLPASEINNILNTDFCCGFSPIGRAETLRTTFWLSSWLIELDETHYLGRCDYELECENADSDSLARLKVVLAKDFGIDICYSQPKFARFCRALECQSGKI